MLNIFVDADSCPVKQEVFRVAQRYGLKVTLVANSPVNIPNLPRVEVVVVGGHLDAADDWIADHCEKDDIVISADIPLASRCIKKSARVLGPKGVPFTESSIGTALGVRDLMTHLRGMGLDTGGSPPYSKRDRSRFLQALDSMIQAIRAGR